MTSCDHPSVSCSLKKYPDSVHVHEHLRGSWPPWFELIDGLRPAVPGSMMPAPENAESDAYAAGVAEGVRRAYASMTPPASEP